jgi:hypothetical protein
MRQIHLKPKDLLAALVFIVCAMLVWNGGNGTFKGIMVTVTAAYFKPLWWPDSRKRK